MTAAIHVQVALALQAASSVMELQTLLALAVFAVDSAFSGAFCCACAAKANIASTAIIADAASAFPIAVTLSPDSQEAHSIVWIWAIRKRKWLRSVARDRSLVVDFARLATSSSRGP